MPEDGTGAQITTDDKTAAKQDTNLADPQPTPANQIQPETELKDLTTGKKLLDDNLVTPAKKAEEEEEMVELTRTEKIKKEEEIAKKKKEKSMKAWGESGEKKAFGFWEFTKFTFPRLWAGGFCRKLLVFFNFVLVISVKLCNVLVPIVLKYAVEAIICDEKTVEGGECPTVTETYLLIGLYGFVKFAADFINYIREIPFAHMAARAEISIAHDVYDHVTRLSLAFHLSRETGKVIRIVSKGSQSFAQVLRLGSFNLFPICLEIFLTLIVFATMFAWQFTVLQLTLVFLYMAVTYFMTERRAGSFALMTKADQNYNQKATDALLNFETVKYFNAEEHEQQRFDKALTEYKR